MAHFYGTAEYYAVAEQREAASAASRSAFYSDSSRSRWQNRGDVAHACLKAVQLQEASAHRYRVARGLMGLDIC